MLVKQSYLASNQAWHCGPTTQFTAHLQNHLHLIKLLEMLEFALKSRLEHNLPGTARKGDATRYLFMVALVTTYQSCFGKNPSASPAGNFRAFLNTLSNIIDIRLGSDLLKRVIADFKI